MQGGMKKPVEPVSLRGTGRTSRALQSAPPDAVYVVHTYAMERYARDLAHHLGRKDITIKPMSWLEADRWRGTRLDKIVLDHACVEAPNQHRLYPFFAARGAYNG